MVLLPLRETHRKVALPIVQNVDSEELTLSKMPQDTASIIYADQDHRRAAGN
jgi:hypothetical protein